VSDDSVSPREPLPDLGLHLEPDVRAALARRFDVDALEELLQMMRPEERSHLLASLSIQGSGIRSASPMVQQRSPEHQDGSTQDVRILVRTSNATKQALLDRIWAPYWDELPKGAVDDQTYPFPGRELARARQAARARDPAAK
jgi:hypothetical protein